MLTLSLKKVICVIVAILAAKKPPLKKNSTFTKFWSENGKGQKNFKKGIVCLHALPKMYGTIFPMLRGAVPKSKHLFYDLLYITKPRVAT